MSASHPPEPCRVDAWLWRARFFKTRALAARFVGEGRVRRVRAGETVRLDKPSRTVRSGDSLVFALGGQVISLQVSALGTRRGPAAEARSLYLTLIAQARAGDAPGAASATRG